MRCAIMTCGHDAVELVAHPGRVESPTPLCDYHAAEVHRTIDGSEVVGDV